MNRILKVAKYQILDTAKAVGIFYAVMAALFAFALCAPAMFPGSRVEAGGFRFATPVFLLVVGLNSFKPAYIFCQANGVTRRQFYLGGLIALAATAIFMTAIDTAVHGALELAANAGFVAMPLLYPESGFSALQVFMLSLDLLAAFAGWFITMLYYRSGKALKVAISLSPAAVAILLPLMNGALGGRLLPALGSFFRFALGLSGTPNPCAAALSMAVAAAALAGLCFLLVRRAPVKEQER